MKNGRDIKIVGCLCQEFFCVFKGAVILWHKSFLKIDKNKCFTSTRLRNLHSYKSINLKALIFFYRGDRCTDRWFLISGKSLSVRDCRVIFLKELVIRYLRVMPWYERVLRFSHSLHHEYSGLTGHRWAHWERPRWVPMRKAPVISLRAKE